MLFGSNVKRLNDDDMKKIIPIIIMMICAFTSCSDNDEPIENVTDQQIKEIASVLNGTFVNNDDDKNIHEITFAPYPAPQEEDFTIPGEYVDIDKKVMVYGECEEVEYFGDMPISTEWRYIIDIPYEGAQPELWFYPISVYGRYETHDITIINSTSFVLDDKTYYKQ